MYGKEGFLHVASINSFDHFASWKSDNPQMDFFLSKITILMKVNVYENHLE